MAAEAVLFDQLGANLGQAPAAVAVLGDEIGEFRDLRRGPGLAWELIDRFLRRDIYAYDRLVLVLDEPQRAITSGQGAIFYDNERVLGGGWIADVGKK